MGLCRVGSPVTLSIRCIVVSETLTPLSRLPAPLHPHSDSPLYLTHSTTEVGVHIQQTPRHATETVVVL